MALDQVRLAVGVAALGAAVVALMHYKIIEENKDARDLAIGVGGAAALYAAYAFYMYDVKKDATKEAAATPAVHTASRSDSDFTAAVRRYVENKTHQQ